MKLAPITHIYKMIMKFKYNIAIDKKCWKMIDSHDFIFGETKKTQNYPVTEVLVNQLGKLWSHGIEEKFYK